MDSVITRDILADKIPRFMGDYEYFLRECLGHADINEKHSELCSFLQNNEKNFKLILMPRYSFKSHLITIGYSLWTLINEPNSRILIYSDSAEKAKGFLQGIKNHILGTAERGAFKEYFGECHLNSGKWNENEIEISLREHSMIEPSVDTGGIETSKVGKHYDLIIFDDIVSDLNVTTKQQLDKVYDCYKKSLSLLCPTGKVLVVGTRWHFADAYGRMLKEKRFGSFVVDCEEKKLDGRLIFSDIGLTREFLDQQKEAQGSYFYSCLYRQNPISDEEAIFKKDKFAFYDSVQHEALYITCALDPAGEGTDSTAFTVCGTDKEMNVYVLDVFSGHLKPNQIINKIIELNYKWSFDKFGVETNFFRGMLEKEIKRAVDEEIQKNPKFKLFAMEEFLASRRKGDGKFNRILALEPYHNRGALLFKGTDLAALTGDWYELAYQMLQVTASHWPEHDDLMDSLAYHMDLIRPGGVPEKVVEPPYSSAAWFEKYLLGETERVNRRLPRKFRRDFEMAFN